MGDDALARAIALLIVAVFFIAFTISYITPTKPVPPELYPLATMAVGYLLGHKLLRNDKDKK